MISNAFTCILCVFAALREPLYFSKLEEPPQRSFRMRLFCTIWILLSICVVAVAQSLKQGIHGQVFLVASALPDSPSTPSTPNAGIKREVAIYELTTLDMAAHKNGFFENVPTKLVASILSADDGSFRIKLPPGTYSVFIKEGDALYANLFDQNRINPVVVKPRKYTWLSITVEYPGS